MTKDAEVCTKRETMMTTAEGEVLAQSIADAVAFNDAAFAKLADYREPLMALWLCFDSLGDGEKIMGCETKTEYCKRFLNRSMRAVQHLIYGREQCSLADQELALEETTDGIVVPPEVQNAQEHFPVKRPARRKVAGEKSDVEKLRHQYEGVTSFKWKLNTSNISSGVDSCDGHFDLTLVGLTPDELKRRMELLA